MTNKTTNSLEHLGIILDGNRRWARAHGLPTLDGHRQGAEVFKQISLAAFDRGVRYLSAFVFSTENWRRTEEEVSYLMKLVVKAVEKYLEEFNRRGIRIVIIGQRDALSKTVLASLEKTESQTRNNTQGTLALCFNYGGQQEIVDATKKIIDANIASGDIDEKVFEQFLYAPELPPVDLLIRTSGEQRTSGFMLWQAAYAELLFSPKYWPDFTVEDLDDSLRQYAERQRRFGG